MKQFWGKPVVDVNESGFFAEMPYYEDMRVVFLAHIFEKRKEELETIAQVQGLFRYYYLKTWVLRRFLNFVLFVLFLFKKPSWCAAMGDTISADCSTGADGTTYFTMLPVFMRDTQAMILAFGIQYFLVLFHVLKIHFSKAVVYNEMLKFWLLMGLFVGQVSVSILESVGVVGRSELPVFLGLLFVFSYFTTVIKALRMFFKMISFSWEVLVLWFLNVFIFALIARLAFENVDIGAASFFQGYSFASFADALVSILGLMSLEHFPDVLLDAHAKHPLSVLLFVPFLIFSCILLGTSIIGNYYFHFKMCYIENANQQYARFPQFRTRIVPLLQEKFLDPTSAKAAMHHLALQLKNAQIAGTTLETGTEARQATLFKLKRTVRKIKILKSLAVQAGPSSFRALYLRIRASFAYKVVDFVLSAYAVALPMISLARGNGLSIPDNVQTSELLGTLFLLDFITHLKFSVKERFWSFLKVADVASSAGMVLFSHILYLYPLDFRSDTLIASDFFFRAWALASLIKLGRIHKVCLNAIDYKLIIKTVLHIMPLIADFLVIYVFTVVLFASAAHIFLGGFFTGGIGDAFHEATGGSLNAVYHFNDLLSSFVSISFFDLGGEFADVGLPAVVAYRTFHSSQLGALFLTIFFYVYNIISGFMIINLIIGLTMDFVMAYGDNNAALIKTNRAFTSNTNVIDRFLGLKTLDDYQMKGPEAEERPSEEPAEAVPPARQPEMSLELSKDFESVEY